MRVGFSNFYRSLDPAIFAGNTQAPIGDDLLLPFVKLIELGKRNGIRFESIEECGNPDAILFADMPDRRIPVIAEALSRSCPKYLITFENEGVKPDNWTNHAIFERVFTWADLQGSRYVRLFPAHDFGEWMKYATPSMPFFSERRLAMIMCSNKSMTHPGELYSERRRTIEWFAKFHPSDLDLFGPGWQTGPAGRYLGTVSPGMKRRTLTGYRFAICYENLARPGYITEKLFDAMIAGCVPVYWGASDIEKWVDPAAFIDRRRFCDHASLYAHLSSMSEDRWQAHRIAARRWMEGTTAQPFTIDHFARTILNTITEGRR